MHQFSNVHNKDDILRKIRWLIPDTRLLNDAMALMTALFEICMPLELNPLVKYVQLIKVD